MYLKREQAAPWGATGLDAEESGHFRIRDVAVAMSESEIDETALDDNDAGADAIVEAGSLTPFRQESNGATALQAQYDTSVRKIESSIYVIAAAVTALDAIEGKLAQVRIQIDTLRDRGERVNIGKARETIRFLAEHVTTIVQRIDSQCVNFLRDMRIDLKFTELDSGDASREIELELTLISLEKLLAYKMRNGVHDADELCALVDATERVVHNNLHVLSSMILVLFASRDYTDEVSRLVLDDAIDIARANNGQRSVQGPRIPPGLQLRLDAPGGGDEEGPHEQPGLMQPGLMQPGLMPPAPPARPVTITQRAHGGLMALLAQLRACSRS